VLPKLRDVTSRGRSIARNLALENPDAYFPPPRAKCFHNVTVPRQTAQGRTSSLKRDFVRWKDKLLTWSSHTERTSRVQTLGGELTELGSCSARWKKNAVNEKQALTSGHALKQMESDLARTEQR